MVKEANFVCDSNILYEIKEVDMLLIRKILNEAKKNNDLPFSPIQGKIINYLIERKEEVVYQRDLEKVLNLRRSTISGVLRTMEKNDLIKRIDVEEDGRVKRITLTKRSLQEHSKILKRLQEIQKVIIKDIDEDDLKIFLKVMNQIKKNLSEESD